MSTSTGWSMAGPTLTPVQMAAVDQMANPKNNPGSAFFLTGEAGVGKSEVIRALIRRLNENFRNHVYVTATTGVAAVEIGGATLASFLGVGIDGDTLDTAWVDQRIKEINTERKLYKVKERLLLVTHLIIDEVSMMKAQFWSNLDSILRGIRRNQLPYGGVIVIAVGDFFQLPPVQKRGVPKDDRRFFAFQAPEWKDTMKGIVLPGSHRHAGDPVLAGLLSRARVGALTDDDHILLRSCIRPPPTDGQPVTYLYAHNVNVDAKNREALQVLPGQVTVFEAFDNEGGGPKKKVGTTGGKQWDPFSECRALKRLELKVGAQVMLLCNMRRADLSALGCYVPAPDGMSKEAAKEEVILANGAVGRVVSISGIPLVTVNGQVTSETEEKWPVVHFPGYKGRPDVDVRLQRHRWEKRDGPRDEHPATREQLPLALAYALSIHKSQGQTITCAVRTDLSKAFESGQAYVALSRVKYLDQLYLEAYDPLKVTAHPDVVNFYKELQSVDEREDR